MRRYGSKRATRFRSVMKMAIITRIGLLLAFSQGSTGWATTIFFDVDRIMATAPKAAGPPNALLQRGHATYPVCLGYLRTLADARTRVGRISGATAGFALIIEKPSAYKPPVTGSGILISTRMLDHAGSDTGKAVVLLGKMYGQLQMNHAPSMVSALGRHSASVGTRFGGQAGDLRVVADDAGAALGLMGASLVREAKKFFPDPIIGIRG